MKSYRIMLGGQVQIIKAEMFHQTDDFISFYGRENGSKVAIALIRIGPGDSIVEERK